MVSTHLKNISQHGNLSPGFGVKIKNLWNHHLVLLSFRFFGTRIDSFLADFVCQRQIPLTESVSSLERIGRDIRCNGNPYEIQYKFWISQVLAKFHELTPWQSIFHTPKKFFWNLKWFMMNQGKGGCTNSDSTKCLVLPHPLLKQYTLPFTIFNTSNAWRNMHHQLSWNIIK